MVQPERSDSRTQCRNTISPEAGGLPAEVYLEKWLVWEKKVLGKKIWWIECVVTTHRQSAATVQSEGQARRI